MNHIVSVNDLISHLNAITIKGVNNYSINVIKPSAPQCPGVAITITSYNRKLIHFANNHSNACVCVCHKYKEQIIV